MRIVNVTLSEISSKSLYLGYVGEKNHVKVIIYCTSFFNQYPNAVATMVAKPPVGDIYPVILEKVGKTLVWNVSEADIANAGGGDFQITFTQNNEVIKTAFGHYNINPSMVATGDPPTPIEDWITQANEILAEIPNEVDQAVVEAVDDWLDDNLDPVTANPPLDRNLVQSNAAAPADMVGDLKNEINDFHDDFYREKNIDVTLTSSDDMTGNINASTGAIAGNEYKVFAFTMTDKYIKVSVNAYHVAPQYRYVAFYSADDLEDCGADTLIGETIAYTNNTTVDIDVPDGAKLLCVAVYSASDSHTVKVIKEYYPVADLIDDLSEDKLDKNQGNANAGKVLVVGDDGEVEIGGEQVVIDSSLSVSGKAADAKKTGDMIAAILSQAAKELLYTILQAGVYTSNQATNIANLAAALYIPVVTKNGKTLVVSNVPTVTSIIQSGKTLICA